MLLFSPAKVNLFFKVIAKRKDGYHEIASLFSAISLYDSMEIKLDSKDHFSVNVEANLPLDHRNHIIKARDTFRRKTSITDELFISCNKQIPQQAGLGGGSSNAATVLWGMNQLFNQPLSISELMQMGAKIGADVPFFFSNGYSLCTGIGEIIEPVEIEDKESFWVALPSDIRCSTERVYRGYKDTEVIEDIDRLLTHKASFYNQLEPVACRLYPQLKKIKYQLIQLGFNSVVLTGSGSAFVCKGRVEKPRLEGVDFFSVRTIERSNDSWYS